MKSLSKRRSSLLISSHEGSTTSQHSTARIRFLTEFMETLITFLLNLMRLHTLALCVIPLDDECARIMYAHGTNAHSVQLQVCGRSVKLNKTLPRSEVSST